MPKGTFIIKKKVKKQRSIYATLRGQQKKPYGLTISRKEDLKLNYFQSLCSMLNKQMHILHTNVSHSRVGLRCWSRHQWSKKMNLLYKFFPKGGLFDGLSLSWKVWPLEMSGCLNWLLRIHLWNYCVSNSSLFLIISTKALYY